MIYQEGIIREKFKNDIQKNTLKHVVLIALLSVVALTYYMYSDLQIRNSQEAFYFRFLPFIIGVPLFIFHLITKGKFTKLKIALYNVFLASGIVMMYAICIIHLHGNALAPSVTGAILIIFIISLEVRTGLWGAILIYFIPLLGFSLSLLFFFKPTNEEFTVLADIYPINIAGFAINRIQYGLRYKAFKSSLLLDLEKQKTEDLYKETLDINNDLQQKTNEIIANKEEIEEKNQRLQESNATKDKFFAIISHDLIGPFNILMGFSDLLTESFEKENVEEQKKYVHHIHTNVHKTYNLLQNLLMWAKAQKDGIEFNVEELNLFLVSTEVVEFLKESAENKLIQINNQINEGIVVNADKNMLETILRNLISNAIKFTPKNGQIFLSANKNEEDSGINDVEISVRDTGVGMSAELQSKLFNIAENVSTKGTEREDGTGLGLILCKEFIDKHGGNIEVKSEPDNGSEFIFTLPG
ncbi:MAG: HAMP domain-containing histidine kinase [Bacteroidetes bacterium]|nr:HAMP domain-containing histidine kinase [Bacteroidota bacterium]